MRKFLIAVFLIVSVSTLCRAQIIVDGVDITKLERVQFIEVVALSKFLSNKVTVIIDYGQALKFGQVQRIEGPDGKPIVFEGVVAALNFISNNGYLYQDAYTITEANSNVYHFLFKRKDPASTN